jgi:tetratricopeptide (TPR) repeat protein
MLAKQPQDRYQSARELLADLRAFQAEQADGEPWPEDLPAWEEGPTIPEARAQTARRLEALMKTASVAGRSRWVLWIALAAAAFLLGGAAAWRAHPPQTSLLALQAGQTPIPQQENVLRQWYYASELGTEEAWWSVIEYFPEKQYMAFRAKQQLARIYLREGKYDQAMTLFDEFAFLGEPDGEMRAFGMAGQCGVLTLQGRYRESAAILAQLWPIRDQLKDPQMRQMLSHVIKKNRSELGVQTTREWQQWLDEQFREEG